jgi:hypothetical protein
MWGKRVVSPEREEHIDGDQTSRLTGVDEGIERLLHWNGSRRPAVSGARSRTRLWRGCHVRTRCADGVAHTPARTDARRDGRFGRVQRWDGPVEEIRPGEVVWFPPGEKHWHGASPTTALTHIAIQEQLDGKNVEWMEQVSDDQYRAEQRAN